MSTNFNDIFFDDIIFDDIRIRPDIFPSKWHRNNIQRITVEHYTQGMNCSSQLSTKSRLNSSYWKKKPLETLIESYNNAWNFNDQLIICVWDVYQKEKDPPIGFMSFDLCWLETEAKEISSIDLIGNLIWVRPDKRGLGGVVARHVITHFLLYLRDCKLYHPYASLKGIDVTYSADTYSRGGEKTSNIIMDDLEFMKYLEIWQIRELRFYVCD